jgi:hypothetical protein
VLKARLGIDRTGFEISPENRKLIFSYRPSYSTKWSVEIDDGKNEQHIQKLEHNAS